MTPLELYKIFHFPQIFTKGARTFNTENIQKEKNFLSPDTVLSLDIKRKFANK